MKITKIEIVDDRNEFREVEYGDLRVEENEGSRMAFSFPDAQQGVLGKMKLHSIGETYIIDDCDFPCSVSKDQTRVLRVTRSREGGNEVVMFECRVLSVGKRGVKMQRTSVLIGKQS